VGAIGVLSDACYPEDYPALYQVLAAMLDLGHGVLSFEPKGICRWPESQIMEIHLFFKILTFHHTGNRPSCLAPSRTIS
jgi:hypothetical protein